jgi:acyl-CoA thioester hydrolase, YbgC/YbaW family
MKKLFFSEIRVIYGDTDAMGVAYHANYLRWFEVGRTELLRETGYPYSEIEKYPVWLPVTHAHVEYKKPAKYDDVVLVGSYVAELGFASMLINYEITNKESGELLVTGYTRHGITDDKMRPIKLKRAYPELYEMFSAISADSES